MSSNSYDNSSSNRMKNASMQKLKWYCQMCQKQCRDQNGFKCHCSSEAHVRQMELFSQNAPKILERNSQIFENEFLKLLEFRYHDRKVLANIVYTEFISDKYHQHMNSTRWETLNAFIKHLGQTGKCKIENSDKGYYIEYINQDPLKMIEKEKEESRIKSEAIEEERKIKEMKRQLKKLKKEEEKYEKNKNEENKEEEEENVTKIEENENINKPIAIEIKQAKQNIIKNNDNFIKDNNSIKIDIVSKKRKINMSNVDLIMKEEEGKKKRKIERLEKENRSDNWVYPNIIVKIKNKDILEGKLYKRKACITYVKDKYLAYLKVIDSGTEIGMDQEDLETVIPKKGKKVLVLNGAFRNSIGEIVSININKYNCTVLLLNGEYKNETVELNYEDISELYNSDN